MFITLTAASLDDQQQEMIEMAAVLTNARMQLVEVNKVAACTLVETTDKLKV
jgi:oligoribonuclease (3'-5' exoribonuclease)